MAHAMLKTLRGSALHSSLRSFSASASQQAGWFSEVPMAPTDPILGISEVHYVCILWSMYMYLAACLMA